jgi:CHAT domain-containing protein
VLAVSTTPEGDTAESELGAVERGIFDLEGIELAPLPGANDEVRVVGETFGDASVVMFGEQAQESVVKAEPLDRYRVLHFAVHGLVSTSFPERSALVLHSDPAAGEDGLLQAREVSRLTLDADLVTLSACDTGSGRIRGQEGVAALVRPFLVAGARSVVANLWQADDDFTLRLMTEFYQRLAAGADKGAALRDAKLEVIRRFGDEATPFRWAGFVLVGEGSNPIVSSGD